ncbi:MAG: effector-associated domain EAD1-containing protein [Caldilineaceae bacterium]
MNQEIFRNLRDSLASLYSDATSIRRVIADASIAAVRIDFNSNVLNIWHAVLTEAEKTGQVEDLLTTVAREYGRNEDFRNVRDRYEQSKRQDPKPPQSPNSTTNSAQFEAWQRQLASYRQNLALIEERMSEYIDSTDIPLQLLRNKQQTEAHIAELEGKLGTH